MNNNPIGILDSGLGGVTVLKEIIKLLPNEQYLYYSDSKHNPYGEKNANKVFEYVDEIMQYFIKRKCKAVVFACNTATALTIEKIRKKYLNILIIGIEPAYKMIHDHAKYKKTIVMATPATIKSKKFLELYHHYDNQKTQLLPCPNLAYLIEQGDNNKINDYLMQTLPINSGVEAVVLGCTHYPLIKDNIKEILGQVEFFDGGHGVANRLYQVLKEQKLFSDNLHNGIQFIDSSETDWKEKRFFELIHKYDAKL